jgi:pimeloyl-ACP methyl ester carboxylesterase
MRTLAAAARRAGYATYAPAYPSRRSSMAAIVAHLAPRIALFAAQRDGPLHIVTHSLGGLVARSLILTQRPEQLGRVVMLAPPNAGSEIADLLHRLRLNRLFLGRVGPQLRTARLTEDERLLGTVDFDLGIIAGSRPLDPLFPRLIFPRPNDGKVAVAATRVEGMAEHITLPVSHTLMVSDRRVVAQAMAFLRDGRFEQIDR